MARDTTGGLYLYPLSFWEQLLTQELAKLCPEPFHHWLEHVAAPPDTPSNPAPVQYVSQVFSYC